MFRLVGMCSATSQSVMTFRVSRALGLAKERRHESFSRSVGLALVAPSLAASRLFNAHPHPISSTVLPLTQLGAVASMHLVSTRFVCVSPSLLVLSPPLCSSSAAHLARV